MRWILAAFVLGASAGLAGCISAAVTVAKPTALEHQLLGAYEELDKNLVHASSVRGSGPAEAVSFEKLEAQALESRALQRFNEDDLKELKDKTCIAESLDARIVERPCSLIDEDPAASRRRIRVVAEENRARDVLITWAAYELARRDGRSAAAPAELAEVRGAYRRLLREAASAGHLVEVTPGQFREVSR